MAKYTNPDSRPDFSQLDNQITKWWKENNIFEKSVEMRKGAPDYIFYDGPPFMSGMPHYATLLSSLPKDVVPRYQTMKGKKVERVWGWDCHGLPIENKVEKELGLNGRKEIEAHGLADFIQKCYEWNRVGIDNWRWYIDKIGRWADLDNAYRTMDQDFMETIWWTFKQMWDKQMIYKGKRTSLFSTDSSTPVSNFEVSMDPDNYQDTVDTAVTVKFKLTAPSQAKLKLDKPTYLLAWTTTPWTLPSNFGLAVNPEAKYTVIEIDDELYILAGLRLEAVLGDRSYKTVKELKATELAGLSYEQLYPYLPGGENDFKVNVSDYVTTEDGTGVLHVAPAFGEADFEMGKAWNLSFTSDIDDAGLMQVGPWQDTYLRDANPQITADLENSGKLFKQEKYTHRLPYYRYKNPLIYKTQDNYFVDVQKLKQKLIDTNEDINWIPSHYKDGRFKYVLETAPDWSISRSRYWGTAMPVWAAANGSQIVVGSRDELMQLVNASNKGQTIKKVNLKLDESDTRSPEEVGAELNTSVRAQNFEPTHNISTSQANLSYLRATFLGETTQESEVKPIKESETRAYYLLNDKPLDLHKPYIDDVVFTVDGEEYKRLPDTLDVWMDSGSMPFAQFHYPFVNKEKFEQSFPGDFIAEYTGQIRAWFYVLHVISNALFGQPAFKNVLVTGVLAGNDGRKMSKSYGNYPDPKETLEKYGAEALRLYFLGSPLMSGNDMDFSESDLQMQTREFLIPLWNIYKYFITYANMFDFMPSSKKSKQPIDQWMLSILDNSVASVDKCLGEYDIPPAIRTLQNLINETSKWYIRVSRDRFTSGDQDVLDTLYRVISTFVKLAAPIIPFTTEQIYREVDLAIDPKLPESVHLVDYPKSTGDANEKIEAQMKLVRDICDLGQSIRTSNNLKLRQPLATMEVKTAQELTDWMQDLIKEELNVKAVEVVDAITTGAGWLSSETSSLAVSLSTKLDDNLVKEGLFRELTRQVQAERKNSHLAVSDKIVLTVSAAAGLEQEMLQEYRLQIMSAIQAIDIIAATEAQPTKVKGTGISFTAAKV